MGSIPINFHFIVDTLVGDMHIVDGIVKAFVSTVWRKAGTTGVKFHHILFRVRPDGPQAVGVLLRL